MVMIVPVQEDVTFVAELVMVKQAVEQVQCWQDILKGY